MQCPNCGSYDTQKLKPKETGRNLSCIKCGFIGMAYEGQRQNPNSIFYDKFQELEDKDRKPISFFESVKVTSS